MATAPQQKQLSLVVAAAVCAVALIPASRLRGLSSFSQTKRIYPLNGFILRFLCVIALWSLASGTVSPFANAYFSQHLHAPVSSIGLIFSASQFTQVIAVLLSSLVFRRYGLITGIVGMQLAAAIAIGSMASASSLFVAGAAYVGFTSFQWMGEPGIYSLLMNRVAPDEQNGASSMNALTISASQAIAAVLAGRYITNLGYPTVLKGTAFVALISALSFGFMLSRSAFSKGRAGFPLESASHD